MSSSRGWADLRNVRLAGRKAIAWATENTGPPKKEIQRHIGSLLRN